MTAPRMARSRSLFASLAMLVLAGSVVLAAPAEAWSDLDTAYAMTNDVRSWEGLGPLSWDDSLAGIAQAWAEDLAWHGRLRHNPWLADQMWGWWAWGENVGYGPSIEAIQDGWYWSWPHWENMVWSGYSSIGIGIAYGAGGRVYAVQVFGG